MQLDGELFSGAVLWLIGVFYALIMLKALRMAPWRRLFNNEQAHVFFGACVFLTLLWCMRAPIQSGLSYHLLGMTTLTLMFGWSLGMVGASLVLVGTTLTKGDSWTLFPLNMFIVGVLPVTLTQFILVLIRSLLPKNFFIYVLGNAFLTSGLVAVISGYTALCLLSAGSESSLDELGRAVLPYFPLMFLPEALLNGWIMTVIVALKPAWVSSFSDDLYLKGR